MIFKVGPYLYRVKLVHGYIEHEGEPCLGLCDNDQHELLISDVTSEAQRIQITCHEYMEAWIYHFGSNLSDKEDYCDLFGMAMTQFVLDFIRQFHQSAHDVPAGSRDHEQMAKRFSRQDFATSYTNNRIVREDDSTWQIQIFEPAVTTSAVS